MTPRTMLLAGAALLAGAGMAAADTSDKRIALSNNYAGNSWRQAMLTSWDKVTSRRRGRHRRGGRRVHHGREPGDRTGRADPEPDPAGLRRHRDQRGLADGAQRRGQGGLRRRHHGRLVRRHRHRALRLAHRGRFQADGQGPDRLSGRALPDGGNLLEIRGLAGVFVDDEISAGIHEGVAENPQFTIVGSVMATGRRTWRRRRSRASCPACPKSSSRS